MEQKMDLEVTMASLRLNDQVAPVGDQPEGNPQEPRRSSRLKTQVLSYTEKRRVYTKPMKLLKKESASYKQSMESYYLDKRIKRASPNLETIYEDKDEDCMSLRQFQRAIVFNEKTKTKKRQMKAKSVSSQQRLKNKCKVSLDFLLSQLEKVDD